MADRHYIYVNTIPSTLTLDFYRAAEQTFVGTAAFTGAKTVALANEVNAEGFILKIAVTTSATITFPTAFLADTGESRWASKILTLTGTGTYTIVSIYDGTNWLLKASADGGFI